MEYPTTPSNSRSPSSAPCPCLVLQRIMLPQRNDPRLVIPNPKIKIVAPARLPVLLLRYVGHTANAPRRRGTSTTTHLNQPPIPTSPFMSFLSTQPKNL